MGYSRLPIARVLFPRAHSAMRRGGWREHAALRWTACVAGQSNQPFNLTVTPLAFASVAPAGQRRRSTDKAGNSRRRLHRTSFVVGDRGEHPL